MQLKAAIPPVDIRLNGCPGCFRKYTDNLQPSVFREEPIDIHGDGTCSVYFSICADCCAKGLHKDVINICYRLWLYVGIPVACKLMAEDQAEQAA